LVVTHNSATEYGKTKMNNFIELVQFAVLTAEVREEYGLLR
jgi:hypothetical protein